MKRHPNIDAALCATVIQLTQWGLSRKAISEATGLTLGQISYRTGVFDLHVNDFRNGKTQEARRLIERSDCAKHNLKATPGDRYKVIPLQMEARQTG